MTDELTPQNNSLLSIHRDLGRMEGRMSAVEREQTAMKADLMAQLTKQGAQMEKLDAKIDALTVVVRDDRAAVKGGWTTAVTLASLIRWGTAGIAATLAYFGFKFSIGPS